MKKTLVLFLSILFIILPIANVKAEDTVAALAVQLKNASEESYAGNGTSDEPYRMAVSSGAFTAPNVFWGDTTQSNGVGIFAVSFEQFAGDTTAGKLISSINFDLGKNATSVWDGTWSYAFRFPAWTMFDTSTDDLRLSFPYKGNFDTYWTDWTYKFDAVSQSQGLSEEKQIETGDTVMITYYGNHIESQTSRGSDYDVDFNVTDENASATYYAIADQNGYAAFNGKNAIEYGGNYIVQKLDLSIGTENGVDSIDTKGGKLQLNADVSPATAGQAVNWEIVEGQAFASIDDNGLLTAKANGQVKVRAYYKDFTSLYSDYIVTISNQPAAAINLYDQKTGITVTGNIPEDYSLVINPIGSSDESYQNIPNFMKKGSLILGFYDIHFEKDGTTIAFDEPVTVTFPVEEQYNGYTAVIYRNHNGEISEYSTVVKDGKAVIEVDGFSEFLLTLSDYTTNIGNQNNVAPNTSDQSSIYIYVILMAIITFMGCMKFGSIRKEFRK